MLGHDRSDDRLGHARDPRLGVRPQSGDLGVGLSGDALDLPIAVLVLLSGSVGVRDGDPFREARPDRACSAVSLTPQPVDLRPGGGDHLVGVRLVAMQHRDDGGDLPLTRLLGPLAFALVRRAGRARRS